MIRISSPKHNSVNILLVLVMIMPLMRPLKVGALTAAECEIESIKVDTVWYDACGGNSNGDGADGSGCYYNDGTIDVTLSDGVPDVYAELINAAASKYGIDPNLLAAIFAVENGGYFPPFKVYWSAVSKAGAKGPLQFIDLTWEGYKEDGNNDGKMEVTNIYDAMPAAAHYLKDSGGAAGTSLGDLQKPLTVDTLLRAAVAYNAGGGNVQKYGADMSLVDLKRTNPEAGAYAEKVYKLISTDFAGADGTKGQTPDPGGLPQSCDNLDLNGDGIPDTPPVVDGHVFPLPLGIKSNLDTVGLTRLPCSAANLLSCHHDNTAAVDVGMKGYGPDGSEGAPVLAISDGTVKHVNYDYDGTGCNSMEFQSDDGYVYWYGHLMPDKSISQGDQYSVGQVIAHVGHRICTGNKSNPHLHLDRGSPKGSDGGYPEHRDIGFIPLINALFEAIPDKLEPKNNLSQILGAFVNKYPGSAVAVKDLTGSNSAAVNGSNSMQSASLYKLFVAQWLYEQRAAGRISFDQTVDLTTTDLSYAKAEDGRDHNNGQPGNWWPWGSTTKVTIADCLPQMISNSENACGAILKNMAINGGANFGSTTLSPQRTNVNDLVDLLASIASGSLVNQGASDEYEKLLLNQFDRSKIPAGVSAGQVGNKTGSIWLAESSNTTTNDAAIIKSGGHTYTIAVLTNLDPASSATKAAIADLSKQVYNFMMGQNQ